ncbi:MAG: nucleoside monophosphate kinase [Patescibacteria group bacterium]
MTQKTFIFVGRSGCGKGTQAKLLMDYLKKNDTKDVLYIQTGSEIREFIKGNSETQKMSKTIYDIGGLMPEFIAVYMWIKILVEKYTKNEHIVFDGTPRRHHEAEVLNSVFDFYSIKKPYVIYIDVNKEESIERLTARGRFDDNKDDIEERLSWYESEAEVAIDYYRNNKDYIFLTIDGMRTIEDIHKDIIGRIDTN